MDQKKKNIAKLDRNAKKEKLSKKMVRAPDNTLFEDEEQVTYFNSSRGEKREKQKSKIIEKYII